MLNILNSLADFFHVLRALVEGENPAGGAEALVVTNLQKRLQQVEAVQNQALQLVDAGLLAGVVGGQLPDRFEPVAGLGQACGVRNQIGLLVRHEEPAQLCFGLGDACRGGFELREDVVGVSHPAGILHQFRRSAINRRTGSDQADGQPGRRGFDFVACERTLRIARWAAKFLDFFC